jgi:flagellar protein FlaH
MELLSFQLSRDELNQRLGRGIPSGSIVLIEGAHGGGKSVVCQRLAYGFLNNNHSTTIVSTQHTTRDFIKQMYSLDYSVMKFMVEGTLLYIPIYPLVSEIKLQDEFLEKLMGAKALFEKEIVLIDTISSLIKYSVDANKTIDLISFLKRLTGIGKVIILSLDPGEMDESISSQLRSISDISITVKSKVIGGDLKYSIIVNKYNGALAPFARIIGFRIEPRIGFVVEISSLTIHFRIHKNFRKNSAFSCLAF